MPDVNPYTSPWAAPGAHPDWDAHPQLPGLRQCVLRGAAIGVLASVPLAGAVGLFFRFPVPLAGYMSGPGAILPAMIGAMVYGLLGGVIVPAVLGGVGGMAAHMLGRGDAAETKSLTKIFGLLGAAPGVLLLAILDWLIGPW